MNSIKQSVLPYLRQRWEKGLRAAVFAFGAFHMLFAAFCNVLPFEPIVIWEYRVAVILISASFFTLFYTVVVSRYTHSHTALSFDRMFSFEQVFVISFFFWYIVVCLVWQAIEHLPYLSVLKWEIMFTGVSSLILFPLSRFVGKKKSFLFIELLLHLVVISYTVFTVVALYYAFRQQNLILPSGSQAGLTSRMQLVLGTHYNMTGAIACIMFCLSLYMVFTQKAGLKIIYTFFSFIHLLVVILSNSRTDFLGTLFVIVAASFCYSWYLLQKKRMLSFLIRILISILPSLILGVLFWVLRPFIITGFDQISGFSAAVKSASQASSAHINAVLPVHLSVRMPSPIPSSLAVSARRITTDLNGRTDIWRAGLKVIFSNPVTFFFGVTPVRITELLMEIGGLTEAFYGTHNAFLDVGVEFGVPAMLAFLAFSVKIVVRCFRLLLITKGEDFKKLFMIPLTILTLLILNLTEGYLVAYFCIQSYIFFLFCGWVVTLDEASRT